MNPNLSSLSVDPKPQIQNDVVQNTRSDYESRVATLVNEQKNERDETSQCTELSQEYLLAPLIGNAGSIGHSRIASHQVSQKHKSELVNKKSRKQQIGKTLQSFKQMQHISQATPLKNGANNSAAQTENYPSTLYKVEKNISFLEPEMVRNFNE